MVFPEERIALVRTVPVLPELFTKKEWEKIRARSYIHEQGKVCNVTPDYRLLLNRGFDAVLRELDQSTDQFRVMGNYAANLGTQDAV